MHIRKPEGNVGTVLYGKPNWKKIRSCQR